MTKKIHLKNMPLSRKLYLKLREVFYSFVMARDIAEVSNNIEHIYGKEHIHRTSNDCIVVTVMRDGESHIKDFIEHHLSIGFKHIFLIDNGSQDSTISIARKYDKVSVFRCLLPFKGYKDAMRSYLLNRFSYGKWCLLADIDEIFDYPYRENVKLEQLFDYFNARKDSAVLLQMLDMYPDCDIQNLEDLSQQKIAEAHPFFEVETITKISFPPRFDYQITNSELKLHYGGVRKRLFDVNPLLSKLALVKPNWPSYQVNPHWRSSAKISDISCILFHYKFTDSFAELVNKAVSEKQYYQNSSEYDNYHKILSQTRKMNFIGDPTLKFENIEQLIKLGFIQVSEHYKNYSIRP